VGAIKNKDQPMTIAKAGLAAAAFAALIGLSSHAANAAPLPTSGIFSKQSELVQVQYRDRGRHIRPARQVCRTEVVRRWVNGRPIRERVQRCVTRR
jgi:hypothetical protein